MRGSRYWPCGRGIDGTEILSGGMAGADDRARRKFADLPAPDHGSFK